MKTNAIIFISILLCGLLSSSCLAEKKPAETKPDKKERVKKPAKKNNGPVKAIKSRPVKSGAIYRGNVGRTGVFNKTGVVNKPTVKWKVDLGGKLISSPVVWKGTLFVGGPRGLYALDAETGKQKWLFEVKKGVDSSVAVADGTVYFTGLDNNLYAVGVDDGKKIWSAKGAKPSQVKGLSFSPLPIYGLVICPMGPRKGTIAFNAETGKIVWKVKANPDAYASAAASKDRVFLRTGYAWAPVCSYDIETAELLSSKGAGWIAQYHTPAVRDDKMYVVGTRDTVCHGATDTAKNSNDKGHDAIWQQTMISKRIEDNEAVISTSPTIWKNLVFAGNDQGIYRAFDDNARGKPVWTKDIGGFIHSSASVADKSGLIYFGAHNGNLYALDATTGEEKWIFKTGGGIEASPWIGDGVVYISSFDGFIYALK